MSVHTDINDGKYTSKLEYPRHPKKPALMVYDNYAAALEYANQFKTYESKLEEFRAARDAYQNDNLRLLELFKQEALDETLGHLVDAMPNTAKKIFEAAWEHGHGSGLSDVVSHLYDYAEIVETAVKEIAAAT